MNNLVCKFSKELTEKKQKLYEDLEVKCVRDVARRMMPKVVYKAGMRVCIYHVGQRITQTVLVTEKEEKLLLFKTLQEVFP
jgi:hypothetical protein